MNLTKLKNKFTALIACDCVRRLRKAFHVGLCLGLLLVAGVYVVQAETKQIGEGELQYRLGSLDGQIDQNANNIQSLRDKVQTAIKTNSNQKIRINYMERSIWALFGSIIALCFEIVGGFLSDFLSGGGGG